MSAFLLAGALASPLVAQVPARSTYYSVPSWAPDGNTITFESNRDGEAAVYSIRPDGSNLRRLTPAGTRGEQPNWSADGRFLVYSSAKDGVKQLHRMTPDGRNVVPVPGTTNGFLAAFSPDGRWLLFAAQDRIPSIQYRVYVMRPDGSDRRSLGDMAKSNEDPRWTTDGARVVFNEVPLLERLPDEAPRDFVRRRTQAQRLVSVTPDGRETRILEPEEASRLTRDRGLSPDGKWLLYAKAVDGVSGLLLRDQASGTERLLDGGTRAAVSRPAQSPAPVPPQNHAARPAVSPDGRWIAFHADRDGSSQIFVIRADGSDERLVTRSPTPKSGVRWSADGRELLFTSFTNNTGYLFAVGVDGTAEREVLSVSGRDPQLSPDGRRVVYAAGPFNATALMLAEVDGATLSHPRRINDEASSIAWNAKWSPDGARLAFTGRAPGNPQLQIWTMNSDGSKSAPLTHLPPGDGRAQVPAWSPDGRSIVFQSDTPDRSSHLWRVEVRTGTTTRVLDHAEVFLDETPVWFPDGQRLAFQSTRTGRWEVWTVKIDGTELRQITK
ncbi:MAG: PD40 domain-containing protein [Acidobacteria bacterium]|nr:PD40 domain-containing protein [Acidobacteriota bacterium]